MKLKFLFLTTLFFISTIALSCSDDSDNNTITTDKDDTTENVKDSTDTTTTVDDTLDQDIKDSIEIPNDDDTLNSQEPEDDVESKTISIDINKQFQNIEGFGAGVVYYQNWLTAHENAEAIYDTIFTALGLEYVRLGNWYQNENDADIANDAEIIKAAKERLGDDLKIYMSSWSAPGELKVSGDTRNENNLPESENTLKKENGKYVYDQFASWWKRSIVAYKRLGVEIDAISFQNEPDMNAQYEGTIFYPSETDEVAGYAQTLPIVFDSLQTLDNPPKVFAPEVLGIGYGNFDKYASKLDKDKFDAYAYHLYHGNTDDAKYEDPDGFNDRLENISSTYSDKPHFMTEFCPMRDYEEEDMIKVARIINNTLIYGNVAGYINWELIWGEHGQMVAVENPWDKSTWTTEDGFIVNSEYHAIRHFSKFIKSGWSRVDATTENLSVSAFTNPSQTELSVVIVNYESDTTVNVSADGFGSPYRAVQSVLDGEKSVELSEVSKYIKIPGNSITTILLKK